MLAAGILDGLFADSGGVDLADSRPATEGVAEQRVVVHERVVSAAMTNLLEHVERFQLDIDSTPLR